MDKQIESNETEYAPFKLHLGPGPFWKKPSIRWLNVDIDRRRANIVIDFNKFEGFNLRSGCVECIYGSHVFEHMSIWVVDKMLKECCRVLKPGGVMRIVIPDVRKSIEAYLNGNIDYPLFKRRREEAKRRFGIDYTLFDCLREDFLSRSGQINLLGENALAHQNAWDFESLERALCLAGFSKVCKSDYKQSVTPFFDFEGTYRSEATQKDRSLYVDAFK